MAYFIDSDIQIIGSRPERTAATTEVCRSFARKLNLQNYGGAQYESVDFFASRKIECTQEDAAWVSQQIFEECVEEVRQSMAAYIDEMRKRQTRRTA